MRVVVLLFALLPMSSAASAQNAATLPAVDAIVARMNKSEETLITMMRNFRPIVEGYIQNLVVDEQLGFLPASDSYFMGRFDWKDGPKLQTLSGGKDAPRIPVQGQSIQYLPDGFAAMAAPDWSLLDTSRYEFALIRREFLGEARCFVLDVKPRKNPRDGFSGRVWVEDRGYNIIRFNGINRKIQQTLFRKVIAFHTDSWRVNVLPGMWLPSYAYVEEFDLPDAPERARNAKLKAHVRMWAYDPKAADSRQQFTDITIGQAEVRDNTDQGGQMSPLASQRQWELEAERNVIERLEKAGLLASPGEVEQVLDTVLNNLVVTNGIDLYRPVKARVLLTSPFESFTVGHTLVLSRGLIDVLPDEATLATMLAHELAHVALGHPLINTQFAFADRMMVNDDNLLKTLQIKRDAKEEQAADAKVIEMLKKSPYADKLSDTALFLKTIAGRAKQLPNLITPHIGDHVADGGELTRLSELMKAGTPSESAVPALPLGARLVLDPWSSRLELLKGAAPAPRSQREQVPLAITPLIPNIRYVAPPSPSS